jgi:hypothetical protein
MAFRKALAVGIGMIVTLGAATLGSLALLPLQPVRPTKATVTGISGMPSRYARTVTLTGRSDDGLVGFDTLPANLLDCVVGDVVDANRQGVSITLAGKACRTQHMR